VGEPRQADAVEFAVEQWESAGLPHPESLKLMSSLTRANQLMTARMEQALNRFDLNVSRYLLLMSLMVAPSGAYRMGTLRWLLMLHHTTITTLVEKLVRRGLVQRQPDPTDRRSTLVVITDAGRGLAREAGDAVGRANFGLPELDPARRTRLVELLLEVRELYGDLDEEHDRVESRRTCR
jgi:DNA-binding MarR family transcriptional regulator